MSALKLNARPSIFPANKSIYAWWRVICERSESSPQESLICFRKCPARFAAVVAQHVQKPFAGLHEDHLVFADHGIAVTVDIAPLSEGLIGEGQHHPVLDCCTREVLDWCLDLTGRAQTAERALEEALNHRFGWTNGAPKGLTLRHDNGMVFGSSLYRAPARDYGLKQEYVTPYTPQKNGICERFNRSFKEECAWLHRFQDIQEARAEVARYIDHYNHERPHQPLDYLTPHQAFLNPKPAA